MAHDYEASGKPMIAWDDAEAKADLVDGLVRDALTLLDACQKVTPSNDAATALGLLALVAGQDVEQDDDGVLAHRPQGGPGPDHLDGRSRGPPHAQVAI